MTTEQAEEAWKQTGSGHKDSWIEGWLAATAAGVTPCAHRLADARNAAIQSGYMCVDCHAVFAAADHGAAMADFTDRQQTLIRFALWRFAAAAREQANAAAQDKEGRFFQPGAFDAFLKDAQGAEELLTILRADAASGVGGNDGR